MKKYKLIDLERNVLESKNFDGIEVAKSEVADRIKSLLKSEEPWDYIHIKITTEVH